MSMNSKKKVSSRRQRIAQSKRDAASKVCDIRPYVGTRLTIKRCPMVSSGGVRKGKSCESVLAQLKRDVARGDTAAMFALALHYLSDAGRNARRGEELLAAAVARGNIQARWLWAREGVVLDDEHRMPDLFVWDLAVSAAEQGHACGMCLRSSCLATGTGTEEDDNGARQWNRKAADAGCVLAAELARRSAASDDPEPYLPDDVLTCNRCKLALLPPVELCE